MFNSIYIITCQQQNYSLIATFLVNLAYKNKKPRASFVDGEKALLLANAAYKSLLTKKVIKIR